MSHVVILVAGIPCEYLGHPVIVMAAGSHVELQWSRTLCHWLLTSWMLERWAGPPDPRFRAWWRTNGGFSKKWLAYDHR